LLQFHLTARHEIIFALPIILQNIVVKLKPFSVNFSRASNNWQHMAKSDFAPPRDMYRNINKFGLFCHKITVYQINLNVCRLFIESSLRYIDKIRFKEYNILYRKK